ncbi:fungal hydrophobin-domain-containing protein [Boletus edulis BED1]|uniref:Hydrophobin n=1 Tax=Boletus edulis BED1 TaxID=1328754 RepID=A0AAD4BDB0_BOLED|nr:fungal hydrophobin-domain-containing protein [Boletus edulis BED1]
MFAGVFKSTVMVSVVAFLAVARGVPTSTGNSECDNDGQLQCCQQVLNVRPTSDARLAGLLGLGDILGNIGLSCDPINVLGIGNGANCQEQAVCCTDVTQNGFLNFGCSPVIVNL